MLNFQQFHFENDKNININDKNISFKKNNLGNNTIGNSSSNPNEFNPQTNCLTVMKYQTPFLKTNSPSFNGAIEFLKKSEYKQANTQKNTESQFNNFNDENKNIKPEEKENNAKILRENLYIQQLLEKKKLDENYLNTLASLDKTSFSHLNYLLEDKTINDFIENNHLNILDLTKFSNLDDNSFKHFKSLISNKKVKTFVDNKKLSSTQLKNLSETDDNSFKQLELLLENELIQAQFTHNKVNDSELKELAKLNDTEFEQFSTLSKNEVIKLLLKDSENTLEDIGNLAKIPPEKFELFNNLLNNENIKRLSQDDKLGLYEIELFSTLEDYQFQQLDTLLQNQNMKKVLFETPQGYHLIKSIANLKKDHYQQLDTLLKNESISTLINKPETNKFYLQRLFTLENDSFNEVNTLLNNELVKNQIKNNKINWEDISLISYLKPENLNLLNTLIEEDEIIKKSIINSTATIKDLQKLSECQKESVNTVLKNPSIQNLLENNKITIPTLTELATMNSTEEELSKLFELFQNGIDNSKVVDAIIFLRSGLNTDIKNLYEYSQKIDYEQLEKLAPAVKNFDIINKLYFANYHYGTNKTTFEKKDLKLNEDFTQYLRENFVDADKMREILSAFPLTPRVAGELPDDWSSTDKNKAEIIKNSLLKSIDNFKKHHSMNNFEKELSSIFGEEVVLNVLGEGKYGIAYILSKRNSKDLCLKLFHKKAENENTLTNTDREHGQFIELQNGLFGNAHSDNFVKVYMGRTGLLGENDGFLITQFLDTDIEPELTEKLPNADNYTFIPKDNHIDNYVKKDRKRIYIDLGSIEIIDNTTGKKISKF